MDKWRKVQDDVRKGDEIRRRLEEKLDDAEDIIDVVVCGIIFFSILLIFFIMMSIVSKAGEPVFYTYTQCHCNMTEYILRNLDAHDRAMQEFDRHLSCSKYQETIDDIKAKAEQADREREYRQKLINIFGYVPTEDEIKLHKRVAQAEAGGTESVDGIELVMCVGANRCRSNRFPNTLTGVYYQTNQYETVSKGRIWRCAVNNKVERAWQNMLARGYCRDKNILFFTADGYNSYCTPAYRYGNHYFGY